MMIIMIMNLYSAFSIFIYSNALYRHAHLLLTNSVELIQVFPLMNTADSIYVIWCFLVQAHSNGSCLQITFPPIPNNI